jgi:hypothetical protein
VGVEEEIKSPDPSLVMIMFLPNAEAVIVLLKVAAPVLVKVPVLDKVPLTETFEPIVVAQVVIPIAKAIPRTSAKTNTSVFLRKNSCLDIEII